jgi:hypothetical protein
MQMTLLVSRLSAPAHTHTSHFQQLVSFGIFVACQVHPGMVGDWPAHAVALSMKAAFLNMYLLSACCCFSFGQAEGTSTTG